MAADLRAKQQRLDAIQEQLDTLTDKVVRGRAWWLLCRCWVWWLSWWL